MTSYVRGILTFAQGGLGGCKPGSLDRGRAVERVERRRRGGVKVRMRMWRNVAGAKYQGCLEFAE